MTAEASRKLSLDQQADVLWRIMSKGRMMGQKGEPGPFSSECFMRLTKQDLLDLETIWKTIRFMEMHGADRLVMDNLRRKGRG